MLAAFSVPWMGAGLRVGSANLPSWGREGGGTCAGGRCPGDRSEEGNQGLVSRLFNSCNYMQALNCDIVIM